MPGDLFLLYGELGAGKTQLVKGLAKGIGVSDWEYVLSPSFALMASMKAGSGCATPTCTGLKGRTQTALGIEDCLDSGVVAVEWAERVPFWPEGIRITLHVVGENERNIVMEVEDAGRAQIWRHFRREP